MTEAKWRDLVGIQTRSAWDCCLTVESDEPAGREIPDDR